MWSFEKIECRSLEEPTKDLDTNKHYDLGISHIANKSAYTTKESY